MKIFKQIFVIVFISFSMILIFGNCKKLPWNLNKYATIVTSPATNISGVSALCGGTLKDKGNSKIIEVGVCWNIYPNPTIYHNAGVYTISYPNLDTAHGTFSIVIKGLSRNTKYYVRSWVDNGAGRCYGNEIAFTTTNTLDVPILKTVTPSNITSASVATGGIIIDNLGNPVELAGVLCDTTANLTYDTSAGYHFAFYTNLANPSDTFSSNFTSLIRGHKYYIRAYAINKFGTGYGNLDSFTTAGQLPLVYNMSVSNISSSGASSGGNVADDGGYSVTARGVCWSTSTGPTVALSSKTLDGTGTGIFASTITGLSNPTTYYVRAYATNIAGTAYSSEISFTTTIVGTSYGGGIIAYVLQPGDPGYNASVTHGLIAAPTDQSTGIHWGCFGSAVGDTSKMLGSGEANTLAIVSACGPGTAAKLCHDLSLGGYTDWYLPSEEELHNLYINRILIGNFTNGIYWSSSEYNSFYAYFISFSNDAENFDTKTATYLVRAVRSF